MGSSNSHDRIEATDKRQTKLARYAPHSNAMKGDPSSSRDQETSCLHPSILVETTKSQLERGKGAKGMQI
jgi:hypothetical protein